jgi:hypothetical protein
MQEHIDDNSIPKDIPAFAKSFFVEATGGGFTLAPKTDLAKKSTATQPNSEAAAGYKRKLTGNEQEGRKKQKKEFSDKSLKMGLFHIKKGTPPAKALPDKSLLKDNIGACMDFCCHKKKCDFPHTENTTPIGKMSQMKINSSCSSTWTALVSCGSTLKFSNNTRSLFPPSTLTSLATQPVPRRKRKQRNSWG